jgi:hypothetical protein
LNWNVESNQALDSKSGSLLTLFSTVCVHSAAACTAGALHENDAGRFFPLKSTGFRAVGRLAHNFVHKKCEESTGWKAQRLLTCRCLKFDPRIHFHTNQGLKDKMQC